jgi:hypothetical protein
MSHHLRLDFDLVELLSAVHTDHTANHLRHNDHVAQMRLYLVWLLVRLGVLLGLAELLDQTHRLALETAVEPTAGPGVEEVAEGGRREVEESSQGYQYYVPFCEDSRMDSLVKVNAAEGELAKGSLLLELGGLFGIL